MNETGPAFAQFYPRVFLIEDEFRGRRILHEERLPMLEYIIKLIKVIHSDKICSQPDSFPVFSSRRVDAEKVRLNLIVRFVILHRFW